MELIGIFFVACGLLVLAGVAKAVRPDDTARALVQLMPGRATRFLSFNLVRQAVRVGALIEVAIGAFGILFPRTATAALVAGSYALFVGIVAFAKKRGGSLSTCGCFGRPDTPATWLHLALNLVFVAAAVAVTLQPPHLTALASLLEHQPWNGLPLVLAGGVGVWLAYLALSPLATLETARRLIGHPSRTVSS
jgi:hypothetical protein